LAEQSNLLSRLWRVAEAFAYGAIVWFAISAGFALFFGWSNAIAVMAAVLVAGYAVPFSLWLLFVDDRP
jgi:hypothetical protein